MILGPGQLPANPAWREGSPGAISNPFPSESARDAAYPNPSGEIVWMVNPCVPLGKSRLQGYSAGVWGPPEGEPIVSAGGINGNPLTFPIPGVTALQEVYTSPVIPDYMIPNNIKMDFQAYAELYDPSNVTYASSMLAAHISGTQTMDANDFQYMASRTGAGANNYLRLFENNRRLMRNGTSFQYKDGRDSEFLNLTIASFKTSGVLVFTPNATRVRFVARTALITTGLRLWNYRVVSAGLSVG